MSPFHKVYKCYIEEMDDMCLAVPAQLVSREEYIGTVEVSGVQRTVNLLLLPDAVVGDYVLVHAGCAVQIVDEEEANATMRALEELEELEDAYFTEKAANR